MKLTSMAMSYESTPGLYPINGTWFRVLQLLEAIDAAEFQMCIYYKYVRNKLKKITVDQQKPPSGSEDKFPA